MTDRAYSWAVLALAWVALICASHLARERSDWAVTFAVYFIAAIVEHGLARAKLGPGGPDDAGRA